MEESRFANLDRYRTDEKLETEGRPVELADGLTVWVCRPGGHNRKWKAAFAEAAAEIPDDTPDRIYVVMRLAMSRTLVPRWAGFVDRDGEELECTPENVEALLREFPDWFDRIVSEAEDVEGFRREVATKSVQ